MPSLSVCATFFSFNDTWSIKNWTIPTVFLLFLLLLTSFAFSFVHFLDHPWFLHSRFGCSLYTQVVSLPHNLSRRRSFRHWFFTRNLASRDQTRRETRSQEREKVNHDLTRSLPVVACPSLPLPSPFFSFFFSLSTLVAFWPQGSNESVSTRRRKFRENEHGESEIYPLSKMTDRGFFLSSVLISSGLLVLPPFRSGVLFFRSTSISPYPLIHMRVSVVCIDVGVMRAYCSEFTTPKIFEWNVHVVHVCTRICLVRILISNFSEISPTHFFIPFFFPSMFHVRFVDKNVMIGSLVAEFWNCSWTRWKRTNINRSKVCRLKKRKGEKTLNWFLL